MEFDPERGIGSRKPKMGDEEAMPMMLPKKNNTKLRLSSSLQDLSTYNHHHNHNNNTLSFSKSKDFAGINTNNIKKKRKRWVTVAVVVLALLAVASIIAYLSSANRSSFYVVIDSGSTGTRAYVYRATPARDRASSLPFRIDDPAKRPNRVSAGRAYDRVETEPGFHKMVHNASALRAAIIPLLRWARTQVPAGALGRTPVFLYATAGVRRLPPAHSKWVMDNAWPVLRDSPFVSRREWVRVLTGKEEAYFGWIALNYGSGVLGAVPRKPTLGALDLGGSSLQVTFETAAEAGAGLQLRIGSVKHQLTAYSLSGYGLNDAFDASVGHLAVVKGEAKHPCLQTGYRERYKGRVTLVGAPDWEACVGLAKQNGSAFTRPYGSFYAMSGFFVVFRFFNLSADAGLDEVLQKGKEYCEKTWEDARRSVPAQPFVEHYCFRAPYVVSLLRDGLRIPENQVTIGSGSITWTLGVALMEAASASGNRHGGYLGGIAVLLLLLIVFILLLLACAKFARTTGSSGNGVGIGMVGEGRVSISKTMSEIPTHSTTNLPNIQFEAFWSPHRTQMQLQSRRSQSREDLNSSLP